MGIVTHVPPGRAGRMWLRRKLDTAARGRDQLDRKLRILVPERERLLILDERCRADWARTCGEARVWLLRAGLLGGEDALRAAIPSEPATVAVAWTSAMGLSYPTDVHLTGTPAPLPAAASNAAIGPAIAAWREALLAGVRLAAASEALRRVEEEVMVTRQRLRALDKRWVPNLVMALESLELALEQAEQEDGVRLRRASGDARWTS